MLGQQKLTSVVQVSHHQVYFFFFFTIPKNEVEYAVYTYSYQ